MSERRIVSRRFMIIVVILLVVIIVPCYCCCIFFPPEKVTTVFLVRHAEYDTFSAPSLNADGVERAEKLAEVLCRANVNVIYTTDTERAKETIQPLADAQNLQPIIYWGAGDSTDQSIEDLVH